MEGRLLILGLQGDAFLPEGNRNARSGGIRTPIVEIKKDGDRQQIQVTLEPLPGIAVITVDSTDDFDLSVDEVSFGASTRVEVELERGPPFGAHPRRPDQAGDKGNRHSRLR